jgi:RHS repeat-associated protein
MNCTGFSSSFVYDGQWASLLRETKDVAVSNEGDRLIEYKYGDANESTQQTKKTVKLHTDGSGGTLEVTDYAYNLQGRMSVVKTDSDGDGTAQVPDWEQRHEYTYDTDGSRVSQTVTTDTDGDGSFADETPVETTYLNDKQNPTTYAQVLEESLDGSLLKTYSIGQDVFAEALATAIRHLLKDGHGSTRMLVDAAGLPLSGHVYRFDAYGNAIGFNPADALTTLLYNSEQFDHLTGLSYLRARYYEPASGRFNRLDPFFGNLHDPQSLHKYLFAYSDPIGGVDPTGTMTLVSCVSALRTTMNLGALVGGVVGAGYGAVRNFLVLLGISGIGG